MTTFNRMGKYSQVIIVCIAGFGISATHADEIRLQTQSDFGQLDPAFWQSKSDQTVIDAIFPKLIESLGAFKKLFIFFSIIILADFLTWLKEKGVFQ